MMETIMEKTNLQLVLDLSLIEMLELVTTCTKGGHCLMTQMQAEYSKILETRRHNLATEKIQQQQADTGTFSATESARHNRVTEALSANELAEAIRHDQATEGEAMRHNGATEAEVNRHNIALEKQAQADNALKQYLGELENATKIEISNKQLQNAKDIAMYQGEIQKYINNVTTAMKKYEIDTNAYLKSSELDIAREKVDLQKKELAQDLTIATTSALLRSAELDVEKQRLNVSRAKQELDDWKAHRDVEHLERQDALNLKKLEKEYDMAKKNLEVAQQNAKTAERNATVAEKAQALKELDFKVTTAGKQQSGLFSLLKSFWSGAKEAAEATTILG